MSSVLVIKHRILQNHKRGKNARSRLLLISIFSWHPLYLMDNGPYLDVNKVTITWPTAVKCSLLDTILWVFFYSTSQFIGSTRSPDPFKCIYRASFGLKVIFKPLKCYRNTTFMLTRLTAVIQITSKREVFKGISMRVWRTSLSGLLKWPPLSILSAGGLVLGRCLSQLYMQKTCMPQYFTSNHSITILIFFFRLEIGETVHTSWLWFLRFLHLII